VLFDHAIICIFYNLQLTKPLHLTEKIMYNLATFAKLIETCFKCCQILFTEENPQAELRNCHEQWRFEELQQANLHGQLGEKNQEEENSQIPFREMEQHVTRMEQQLREQERLSSEREQQLTTLQGRLREKELQEVILREQLREKYQQEENSQTRLREMEQHVTRMEQQLREKEHQLENSERLSREKEQHLANLQRRLLERESQAVSLQQQMTEQSSRVIEQQRMEQRLGEKHTALERLFEEKALQNINLCKQLRDERGRQENSERHLRELEQQLREKDEHEENLQSRLREMEQQWRGKDEQKENLQGQLREMEQQLENLQRQYNDKEGEKVHLVEQVTTLEGQLRTKEQEVNELEISLSTAQQALSDRQRQQSTPDWVISRDQIQLTDTILGIGGWGSVVEGKYCGCAVAVKQIHDLILSPHNRNLFEREMDIASRCRHPCLLQFIGATHHEGSPLFVTELMESSLRALLEQRPLTATELSILSLDISQALSYLHQKKPSPIIHRDISSANVLLWRQGDQWRGKVSDYGTANFMQHTMTVGPGATIYMAPEARTSYQTVKVSYELLYDIFLSVCHVSV